MKQKKLILLAFLLLFLIPIRVLAETTQNLSLKIVKCDPSSYTEITGSDQFYACVDDYLSGNLDTYEVENNGDVEPGNVLMAIVQYTPGSLLTTTGLNATITYDSNKVTVLENPDEVDTMFYDFDKNQFPKSGRNTNWTTEMNNVVTDSSIKLIATDLTSFKPLVASTELGYFFLEINEDATPGGSLNLDYSTDPGDVVMTNEAGDKLEFTTTDFVMSVYGNQSKDATLSNITITNNSTNYTLLPSLNASVTTYSTTVPNNISSVLLNATTNNEYATILAASLGEKTLNVGDNQFQIVVTSQYGNIETYTINIKRLSNIATLSSINLTNNITLNNFSSGTYTYTTSVPYATKTTNISATLTNPLSFIESGTGTFNLTNYGNNPNIQNIVVKAENCKNEYAYVEGNTCTSNTYTININRGNPSANNYLSDIKVNGTSINNFVKTTDTYTIANVSNQTTQINLTATKEDSLSTIISGTGMINLTVGDNALPIVVKAEDGTNKIYTINVRRLSNINTLANLSVTSSPMGTLSPLFQTSFTGNYTYNYQSITTSVNVSATVTDTNNAYISIIDSTNVTTPTPTNSSINTKTETFNVPDVEKVTVMVTAEDGTIGYYIVNLNRTESSDANLKSLSLSSGTLSPVFSSSTVLYNASVEPDITSVEVTAIPNSSYAEVTSITGNSNLQFGANTITVAVEAEDGSDKSYIINLTRNKYQDATLSDIKIDGVTIDNFDPEVTTYNLTNFTKNQINLTATNTDSLGSVTGTGIKTLSVGDNQIVLTSSAHDTTVTKTYTININRLSNVTTLKSLSVTSSPIGTLSPSFQTSFTGEYTYTYPSTVTEVSVTGVTSNAGKSYISIVEGNTPDVLSLNTTTKTFTVPDVEKVTIIVTAEDGTVGYHILNLVRQSSSDANLKSLSLSSGTLSPTFSSGTVLYNASVEPDITSVEVTAIPNSSYAEVTSITGNTDLQFGVNTVTVTVKPESGTDKSYIINLTREKYQDATLSDIKIDGVSIENFDSDTLTYNITDIPYDRTSVEITATNTDSLGSVSGTGPATLNTGENQITLTSCAHDTAVIKTYTLNITRAQNNDTGIKEIKVADVTATWNKTDSYYEVTVPNNISLVNSSNIVVIPNDGALETDPLATVLVPEKPLITTTTNSMNITVTAEDGTINIYTIIITREESNVATLSSITVTDGSFSPSFSPNVDTYTVLVPKTTTTFTVSATKTDPNASLTGVGEYSLVNGIKQVELVVISEDESITKRYTLNVEKIKSSDNTLSDLTVSDETNTFDLNPFFASDTTTYNITVPGIVDNINISATPTDSNATIESGAGEHQLDFGDNTFTVRVKSESEAILDYTINIERLSKTNSNLSDLKVDSQTVENFLSTTKTYDLGTVPYSKETITIEAMPEDTDATITSGTGTKNLSTGINQFDIVVTAHNGTTSTYTITITREKNNDANLKVLSVNGVLLTPSFSPNVTSYNITVPNTTSNFEKTFVTAIANDTNATIIKDENVSLSTQNKTDYEITVTAEDGTTTKTYTIEITREKSTDNTLKNVILNNATLSPTFSPLNNEYTITIPYGETEFTIEGVANNDQALVQGNGTYINTTSSLSLSVTSETGVINTYNFNVVNAPSNDATLNSLSVEGYAFTNPFISTTTVYTIGNVPYTTTSLKINAEATNVNASLEFYVNTVKQSNNIVTIPTSIGEYTITVKVIAADGITSKLYNIRCTKEYSSNAYLSSITPNVGTISFNKTSYLYTLNVGSNTTSVLFNFVAEDENASISANNSSNFKSLSVSLNNLTTGANQLDVLVTAQDGITKKTYTISVVKATQVLSNNATLSNLSVNGYSLSPIFNNATLNYSIGTIPYQTDTLTVNATTSNGSATVEYIVNSTTQDSNVVTTPLANGTGIITVKVTAEDGVSTKSYKINYSKTASTNAYLSALSVSKGELVFDKNTFSYQVNLDANVTSVNLMATLEDPTASMSINGTIYTSPHTLVITPITNNTTATIIITSESGTVLTYTVVFKTPTVSETITSIEYGHTIADGMIKTARINQTVLDMKNQLDNDNQYLEIWNSTNTEKLSNTTLLATGQIVKLIINDIEVDRQIIVVKGDVDGSGVIDLFDAVKILNHYLQRTLLTGAYLAAGDTNNDNIDDLFDAVLVLNHFLERTSLFN